MKKLMLVYLLLGCGYLASAQSLTPSVVASSGDQYAGAGYQLSFTLGEVATTTYFTGSSVLTQGFQQPWGIYSLYGQLTYSNTGNTPMMGSQVTLKTLGGAVAGTAATYIGGQYYLFNVSPGIYKYDPSSSLPVGSINATDALKVLQHFVHQITLTGLYKAAADVDNSGSANSVDALLIAKFSTGLIASFPAGAWLFSKDTVNLTVSPFLHNLKAICVGDVNGSFVPFMKSESLLSLITEGEIFADPNMEVEIPLHIKQNAAIGAITLIIIDPSNQWVFTDVRMKDNLGTLVHNPGEGLLRIAWYSTDPLRLKNDDAVFFIRAKRKNPANPYIPVQFVLGEESEVADPAAYPYTDLELSMPQIKEISSPDLFFLTEATPNPAQSSISFGICLPDEAKVTYSVVNLPGQLIMEKDLGELLQGQQRFSVETGQLQAGTYYLVLTATTQSLHHNFTRRFVVVR